MPRIAKFKQESFSNVIVILAFSFHWLLPGLWHSTLKVSFISAGYSWSHAGSQLRRNTSSFTATKRRKEIESMLKPSRNCYSFVVSLYISHKLSRDTVSSEIPASGNEYPPRLPNRTPFSLLECLPAYPSDFCGDRTYQRLARASSRDPIQILCLQWNKRSSLVAIMLFLNQMLIW